MYIVVCYVTYLAISLAVTIWVARTLHHNGRSFLIDAFHSNVALADSVNHLLVVGFYLINIGYVTLAMRTADTVPTVRSAIELVCDKLGVVLIVLGIMHFSISMCSIGCAREDSRICDRQFLPMREFRFSRRNVRHNQLHDCLRCRLRPLHARQELDSAAGTLDRP
jgi:hypothetical protein